MRWPVVFLLVAPVAMVGCFGDDDGPEPGFVLQGALDYLSRQRQSDGRFAPELAPYVAEAAWWAGHDPAIWPTDYPVGADVVVPAGGDFMARLRPSYALALTGLLQDDAGGLEEIRAGIMSGFDGEQFGDPLLLNDDAFAIPALEVMPENSATRDALLRARAFLIQQQNASGGWSWRVGGAAESDMTGIILYAVNAGELSEAVASDPVLHFLETTRNADGGSSLRPGSRSNCDSTVWSIRARALLAQPIPRDAWGFLLTLRNSDGGFAHTIGGASNALCTSEVAVLLALGLRGEIDLAEFPS